MQPFDWLTENDKEVVRQWCINYANAEPQSIEKILKTWNKNKRTLYRAFGKQLEISFPIHQKVNSSYRHSKWRTLYSPFICYDKHSLINSKYDPRNHIFINNLKKWFRQEFLEERLSFSTIMNISEYLKYYYIERGKTTANKCFSDSDGKKVLKIPEGTKIMRAIRKVLEYYSFPYMESFNKWRDDISIINTDKEINAELVVSINPVDFITMSDNKSGWTSCMSWIDNGAYSTGTIEMMNSNLAAVAYLRSSQDFDYNGLEIPNKTWRTLVFIHKDILIVGKHYPYQSEVLAKIILDKLQPILKKNIGWKYHYKNQLYRDMIHSYSNNYIRDEFQRMDCGHKIYTYTNIMYHDILEDHGEQYWCCRNFVEKNLYLNLSGPATCMCCGEPIDKFKYNDFSPNKKYCEDCEKNFGCCGCGFVGPSHAKDRIVFKEQASYYTDDSTVFYSEGCPDCLFETYLWNDKYKCLALKSRVSRVFEESKIYRPLTRERILESEVRGAIPVDRRSDRKRAVC
jgi:hypothetical protein